MSIYSRGRIVMLRAPICLLLLGLGACRDAADDNGLALLGFFEKTCAWRPALPTALQQLAKAAGFASEYGDVTPDTESGDKLDLLYFAERVQDAAAFKLNAYFSGSRDAPLVICAIATVGVNGQDLAPAIEAAEKVASPATENSNDGAFGALKWAIGAAGGDDWLELRFRRDEPRRTSLTLSYQIRKP
jgi:hypothetical protein